MGASSPPDLAGRLPQNIEVINIQVSHDDYIHRDSFWAVGFEAMLIRVKSEPHMAKEHACLVRLEPSSWQ